MDRLQEGIYDMVSHSWIMDCLDMIGAADAVKCLLGESMKTWRTNLMANDECLGTRYFPG